MNLSTLLTWRIVWYNYEDELDTEYKEVNESELKQINQGVQEVRDNYEKRLKTYYKRYGDKLIAKGYWKNR